MRKAPHRLWHSLAGIFLAVVAMVFANPRGVAWAQQAATPSGARVQDVDAGGGPGKKPWPAKVPWKHADGGAPDGASRPPRGAGADAGVSDAARSPSADALDGGAPVPSLEERDAMPYAPPIEAPPSASELAADAGAGTTAPPENPSAQVLSNAAAAATGPTIRIPPTDAEKAEGSSITRIEISNNRRVSKDDISTYMREHIGQPFRIDALTADVHALWDSGFFDDVEVDLERNDQGVSLRFIVRERPNIKSIEFAGNDEIENDKLLEAVEIKPNTILSVPAVRRSVQKIKDAYAEKGYFLADCEFKVEQQRDNEVIVHFKITEHQPVTVRRITFIGNLHVPDDELREMMQTGNGGLLAFGSGGPYRQDVFERDILQINGLYYDKGFMSVQIGTPRVMLTPDRQGIEITIVIHEGPRYKIRQLKIFEQDDEGKEIEPLNGRRALVQMLHAHSGDYFNRASLLKDLQDVRALYRDHGYANVEADPQTELDPVHQEVDIIIAIRRGPLVYVERIEVKGNTKTRDKILRREMEIGEGQLFSESKLEHSKRRITALGYFERVDVSTEQGSAPDRIIINFEITEKPTGTFQVGAGFSSVENFIATAQVQQANLFGNGQSLALQAQVSGLRQLISLRFFEPYFLDSDWSFSTELFDTLYVFPDFSRRSLGGSITYGYALLQPWLRLSLTGTVESDQVSTAQVSTFFGATPGYISIFQRLPLANLFNDGLTVSLRPSIVYDTRDNRLFPSSGIYLQGSAELASSYLGSQIQFVRYRATGRYYYNLGGGSGAPGTGFILKLNTEFGYINSPTSEGVPIFTRFFLGGILDVRGYQLRSIGARLPLNQSLDPNAAPISNGANIGGNLEAYENLEFEFPLIDKVGIRGVTFFDAGNAWNTESQFCKTTPAPQFANVVNPCFGTAFPYVRTSLGFGIRWFSPLGPLRFEWGFPLAPLTYEQHSVFEFTIGNFF